MRGEFADVPVGGERESSEYVTKVSERVDAAAAAAFDDGVEDGVALSDFGFANEEPVFFAERGGTDVSVTPSTQRSALDIS